MGTIPNYAPRFNLTHGRWQDALGAPGRAPVGELPACLTWDSLITDPPYSDRTHAGAKGGGKRASSAIEYDPIDRAGVVELVEALAPRTRRWWVGFGDHLSAAWQLEALAALGWYVYAPVVWIATDPAPRRNGDGPGPGVQYMAVARTRTRARAGELHHRPAYYQGPGPRREVAARGVYGAKPAWLAAAVVNDYSRPGDTICDPFTGSGTFLEAAIHEGRSAIGIEADRERYELARARVERAQPRWMPTPQRAKQEAFANFETQETQNHGESTNGGAE
jgi:hypothetical protein